MVKIILWSTFLTSIIMKLQGATGTNQLQSALEVNDIETTIACEDKVLSLDCGKGKSIRILDADYGRFDAITCDVYPHFSTSCKAKFAFIKVQEMCDGKQSCNISAVSTVFGDPCLGIIKYLQVKHKCEAGEWTTTCEHNVLKLNCGDGKAIRIIEADYGRLDSSTCLSHTHFYNRCAGKDAYKKVQERCDKKQKCIIQASSEVFGDPCVGTIKHLRVKHTCEPDFKFSSICEHYDLKLRCENGKTLRIIDALYGRNDYEDCGSDPKFSKNCAANNAYRIVRERCERKQSCSILASNYFFGDPCVGTVKYLQVKYKCEEGEWTVVCEHHCNPDLKLDCGKGKTIKILEAEYGRTEENTCGSNPNFSTSCAAVGALKKVQERCDNKQSCIVKASNAVFGDPCVGTEKYLEVKHKCVGESQRNVSLTTSCGEVTCSLNCPEGTMMSVTGAAYTPVDRGTTTCPFAKRDLISAGKIALQIVKDRCDRKQACIISADSKGLIDPCDGTLQHLKLDFTCFQG